MNILYFISSLNYGGAEKQTILDANMMVKENNVFLGYFTDGPQKEILSKKVTPFQLKKENYLITAFKLAQQVKEHDIQLIHCSLFAAMIVSALSSLFCKVKVVWHFHSHEYELPWIHRMVYKLLARLSGIRRICFVNKELIFYFQERGFSFPQRKILLLYNSANIHSSGENIKESNKIVIGYTGRLVSLKRLEYLIELSHYLVRNKISDFQIHIVGDGDQRTLLEQESKNMGIENLILFYGFQKDVEKYYKSFDLFVNPSREECLSIALIEAGMYGVPSVAFDVGGNNEIIIDAQTGYIVKTREELFEKVYYLMQDTFLRKEMGKNATKHCLTHFSEEVHLKQLKKMYEEVLE